MRYGLIVSILLLLGVTEYAVIELAPLAPAQRKAKLERLPIFKQLHEREDLRRAEEAFERQGAIMFYSGEDTTRWSSFDDFRKDYRNGVREARWAAHHLQGEESVREALPAAREKAPAGSTWDRIRYYSLSRTSDDPSIRAEAKELLAADSSATAEWFMRMLFGEDRPDPYSAEGITLSIRRIHEDMHPPDFPGRSAHRGVNNDSFHVAAYLKAANEGVPEAQTALEQLKLHYGIDVADMLANWNGGHFERR